MVIRRRTLLERGVLLATTLVTGCGSESNGPGAGGNGGAGGDGGAPPGSCDDRFAVGQSLGAAPWSEPITVNFHEKVGTGLGARLFTDLAALTADTLVTPNEQFYIRTEFPSATLDPSLPYAIEIDGLVDAPSSVALADLLSLVKPHGQQLLECSGNFIDANFGLMSVADWAGVPLQNVFDMVTPSANATHVLINGYDHLSGNTPGASWIFPIDQLLEAGAILATEMNGQPLPPDHGAPVRLLVPNWFGCCNIKWVDRITFVDSSAPSTPHMQEYASRTLQNGVPPLANDFLPATMDQTAVPVLIEKWSLDNQIVYRIRGVMWGGYEPTDSLVLQFDDGPMVPVTLCPKPTSNKVWTLWEHLWVAPAVGEYLVRCWFSDATIPQRRLESGRYQRHIQIDEV